MKNSNLYRLVPSGQAEDEVVQCTSNGLDADRDDGLKVGIEWRRRFELVCASLWASEASCEKQENRRGKGEQVRRSGSDPRQSSALFVLIYRK